MVYDQDTNLLKAINPKGSYLRTMGHFKGQECFFTADEALYLLERGTIGLTLSSNVTMSVQHAYHCLLPQPGDFERYRVYSYLKRLGYIVLSYDKSSTSVEHRHVIPNAVKKSGPRRKGWPLIDVGLYTSVGRI